MPEPTTLREQIVLLSNKLVLAAIAKGDQRHLEIPDEDRITDADLEWYEQKILALVGLADDARAATSGWQPIASAPKDGTSVLLWSPWYDKRHGGVMVASYADYGDDRSAWHPYIPCSWTHWMPLPASPARKDGET